MSAAVFSKLFTYAPACTTPFPLCKSCFGGYNRALVDEQKKVFNEVIATLPQDLQTYLKETAGFDTCSDVADSAQSKFLEGQGGHALEKPADVVFTEAVAENMPSLKPATKNWSLMIKFYRACFHEAQKKNGDPDNPGAPGGTRFQVH